MFLEELSEKIWKTKNARFMASTRMKRSRVSSTVSVALLSASIIAVNMLAYQNISEKDRTSITIATVILSTFALVMSLLVIFLRYEYREDNYHKCGCELEKLNQQLKIRIEEIKSEEQINKTPKSLKEDSIKYLDLYNDILIRYNLNHSDFDYRYSLMKEEKKKQYMLSLCYRIRWYILDVYFLYWLIAIVPIVAVVYLFLNIS